MKRKLEVRCITMVARFFSIAIDFSYKKFAAITHRIDMNLSKQYRWAFKLNLCWLKIDSLWMQSTGAIDGLVATVLW